MCHTADEDLISRLDQPLEQTKQPFANITNFRDNQYEKVDQS
jgi:hypothetical protein